MKPKLQIVADNAIPFLQGVLEPYGNVTYLPGEEISNSDVLSADALFVRTRTACNEKLLKDTSVKMVATATIGMDHFDKDFLDSAGIFYTNAPGCNADSVCQYVTAALIEIAEKISRPFSHLTLGIVGVGNIGGRISKVANRLGFRVLCCDPPKQEMGMLREGVSFECICKESDIITFHTPLTFGGRFPTYRMFNSQTLPELGKPCWVINASRGEVVENDALLFALEQKLCLGAVLDVWENEPTIDKRLLSQTLIATPHIAGYSLDGKANGTTEVVRQFGKFFRIKELENYKVVIPKDFPFGELDLSGILSPIGQLKKICSLAYDIRKDDLSLRNAPENFEGLRKNYPRRREPKAYEISLKGALPEVIAWSSFLGFRINTIE